MTILGINYAVESLKLHKKVKKEEIFFLVQNFTILLKTSPEYTQAGGLWEMHVIAKSDRLQRVECLFKGYFLNANWTVNS